MQTKRVRCISHYKLLAICSLLKPDAEMARASCPNVIFMLPKRLSSKQMDGRMDGTTQKYNALRQRQMAKA